MTLQIVTVNRGNPMKAALRNLHAIYRPTQEELVNIWSDHSGVHMAFWPKERTLHVNGVKHVPDGYEIGISTDIRLPFDRLKIETVGAAVKFRASSFGQCKVNQSHDCLQSITVPSSCYDDVADHLLAIRTTLRYQFGRPLIWAIKDQAPTQAEIRESECDPMPLPGHSCSMSMSRWGRLTHWLFG